MTVPHIAHAQIADFNLSKVMEGSVASTVNVANNPRWMAPELLSDAQGTFSADVFAFGVVMWEVLTWDIPWVTESPFEVRVHLAPGGVVRRARTLMLHGAKKADIYYWM